MNKEIPQHQGRSMEMEIETTASPEDVWNAWADPARIAQWFVDRAEGWAYKGEVVTWYFDEFGYRVPYNVVESIPGECVILGGEIPGRPPFLLEVRINSAAGHTVVRLVNSGFLEGGNFDEEYEGVVSGWKLTLAMMKYYVEGHFGIDKQTILAMRPADVDFSSLVSWYTEPELMNKWLTRSAEQTLEAGKPYRFILLNGTPVEGEVAAISNREVATIWEEQSAFFELKGWTAGTQRLIAIRITSWNAEPGFMEHARSEATAALERLAGILGTSRAGFLYDQSTHPGK
jgi:uncharacterized protein YndB with AHSA1/START domain